MKNLRVNKNKKVILSHIQSGDGSAIYHGDCAHILNGLPDKSVDIIIASPPYCMGKEYETSSSIEDFESAHEELLPSLIRVLKDGGSLCWQVGMHVQNNVVTPLDCLIFSAMRKHSSMILRNRLIWTFGHGYHCTTRFSGRHESVMWYTKGEDYFFNLDAVRVPQRYPGKTHSQGVKKGMPSGNPLGKNPGDVWDIPNVKANHIEKTSHPCQYPVAIPRILIRALTNPGDIVLDPFLGSGSTAVAATFENRRFLGMEIEKKYVDIAKDRVKLAQKNQLATRPWNKAVMVPDPNSKVARPPEGYHANPLSAADLFASCEIAGLRLSSG